MLDHLRTEDAAQRPVGLVAQIGEQIVLLRRESLLTAARHRFLAQIDSTRGDPAVAHHLQKFSASAADIEHGAAVLEPGQIELEVLPDVLFTSAKTFSEAAVIELRRLGR